MVAAVRFARLTRIAPLAALGAVATLALASCGGGETMTVTETTAVPAQTETAGTETGPSDAPPSGDTPPAEATYGPGHFQTPTGNIGCLLLEDMARCDIAERNWEPPPPPEPCQLAYGNAIRLNRGGAEFICAGDTARGGPKTLGYGSAAQRGPFLCQSEQAGLTCTNVFTGEGFFLSRQRYEIF